MSSHLQNELSPVEEEPDDLLAGEIPAYFAGHRPPTSEELQAQGEAEYKRARMLMDLHGLTPDVVQGFQLAGRELISASVEEKFERKSEDTPVSPVRYLMIADCLAQQALATDISPYKDPAYAEGGPWHRISVIDPDEGEKTLDHHEYLRWLSGQYIVKANAILMTESDSMVLADELMNENPAEVIPEAAKEAAQDVRSSTQEFLPVRGKDNRDSSTAPSPAKVRQFIRMNAEQPKSGAAFVARLSEIALEELTDSHEFGLV